MLQTPCVPGTNQDLSSIQCINVLDADMDVAGMVNHVWPTWCVVNVVWLMWHGGKVAERGRIWCEMLPQVGDDMVGDKVDGIAYCWSLTSSLWAKQKEWGSQHHLIYGLHPLISQILHHLVLWEAVMTWWAQSCSGVGWGKGGVGWWCGKPSKLVIGWQVHLMPTSLNERRGGWRWHVTFALALWKL
jgi:hypothetical protein